MNVQTAFLVVVMFALAGCNQGAPPPAGSSGADPRLPAPQVQTIPTIRVARVIGWADGAAPRAPTGFTVTRYGEGLDHPRRVYVLANGDVLVAEATTQRDRSGNVQAWAQNTIMGRAGALGRSANSVVLLRDADGDGDVDSQSVFIDGLNQPFGMALIGDQIYVGATDAIWRFPYQAGQTRITGTPTRVLQLPYNAQNNGHWTRDLLASADGRTLFIGVGSGSNIGDRGMDNERGRALILAFDIATGAARSFATGLRNANGLAIEPQSGAIWAVVNERDMLGDDLAPDYLTSVRDGAFYGWPYSYWGRNLDPRITGAAQRPDLVRTALTPDFALGSHVAPLGLAFYSGEAFPARYRGGAFVGLHGSWNRSSFVGYNVSYIPFANGRPSGAMQPFLTGFLTANGEAQGRPVSIAVARDGALLVADDAGDMVWRVAPTR